MIEHKREMEALHTYLRLLAGKGANADDLSLRQALAELLLPFLSSQPLDGKIYRQQVELVLARIDKQQWPAFLAVAREYFYFWMDDIKGVAALNAVGGFDLKLPSTQAGSESLKTLWQSLEGETFSVAENWPIKAYLSALRIEGVEKDVIEIRTRLAKLLMVRLRELNEKDSLAYRGVVDSMLPLFEMRETRCLFQLVVREFYYFWIGDPEASSHLVLPGGEFAA